MTIDDSIDVEVFVSDAGALVMVRGEVDLCSAPALESALAVLPADMYVIVNMAAVDFADSTSLKLLITHHNRLTDGGGSLQIQEPSSVMRRLLAMTGLDEILVGPSAIGN